ncbi:MAG: cbb3-type cytochrome oxidase assembly protein CcoS [Corticimicrobacter sp.]|uniref:cbb3-type cytochrome oxidase assembly protein CcoS n=1 Tax=Corticimicrobacter sp. TaxID=2678536 RepID=UPI0032DB40FE
MEILYLLLPISMGFVLLIGGALWWAIFSGQFEGTDNAAQSVLLDDDKPSDTPSESPEQTDGR